MNTCQRPGAPHPTLDPVNRCCRYHPQPVCRGCFEDLWPRRHRLTATGYETIEDPATPATAVCDFCGHPEPLYEYPCKDFRVRLHNNILASTLGGLPEEQGSVGGWTACQGCAELIDAGQYRALYDRALEGMLRKAPATRARAERDPKVRLAIRDYLQKLHQAFFANRSGPREPLTWDTPSTP